MTGYGTSSRSAAGFRLQVEMKSVNHRYSEFVLRLPNEYAALDAPFKKLLRERVKRGRVDAYVSVEMEGVTDGAVDIDWDAAVGHVEAVRQLSTRFGLPLGLTAADLLAVPGVRKTGPVQQPDAGAGGLSGELAATAAAVFEEAVARLAAMREAEGAVLRDDLAGRLAALRRMHGKLLAEAPAALLEHRDRLRGKISELLREIPLDEQRLAQETTFFAERSDVAEELTRLESHFLQFERLLSGNEPVGRTLDFLIQEMNRETNTIGSKSSNAGMSGIIIEMKAELEKIREQVQNIE